MFKGRNILRRRKVRRIAGLTAALAIFAQALMPLAAGAAQLDLSETSKGAGTIIICTAFGLKAIPDPFAGHQNNTGTDRETPPLAGNAHCVLSAAAGFCGTSSAPVPGSKFSAATPMTPHDDHTVLTAVRSTSHSRAPPA